MTVKSELKSWLERPDLSAPECLRLCIKVWNSVEFTYTSKYEVIVEQFIRLLSSNVSPDERVEFLKLADEFVTLSYPVGALSTEVRKSLLDAVFTMSTSPDEVQQHIKILRSLQMHNRMSNFYNSTPSLYGKLISKMFANHLAMIEASGCVAREHGLEIKQHLSEIKTFCQYNLSAVDFETIFIKEFTPALTNLAIKCQSLEYPVDSEYFSLLQLIFFNAEQTATLKAYFKENPKEGKDIFNMFPANHILLTYLDALLATFHNDKEMVNLLMEFVFVKFPSTKNKSQLLIFRHVLFLLKKYSVNIQHYDSVNRISNLIMAVVAEQSQSHSAEVLDFICKAVQWNPMVIQDDVLTVIVQFMKMEKDPKTLAKYTELVYRVMGGYTRLNRFEKKTAKLLEMVKGEMGNLQVPKKQKRKSVNETSTPAKKRILNDSSVVNGSESDESHFISLLEQSHQQGNNIPLDSAWENTWTDLTNIWPRAVAQLWSNSVSNLVTKTSLMIWKSLLINLKEALQISKSKAYDGPSILYVEFVSCFTVGYLTGSRVLEHTDQLYDTIVEMCEQTKGILKSFGHDILETEHNAKLVNAFLSVAEVYGTFEMSLLYYHPDSMVDSNAEATSDPAELKTLDLQQKTRSIFDFLTEAEWSLVEQRVINFGKENCRLKFMELNFHKVKAIRLGDVEYSSRETKTWNKTILGNYELITKLMENRIHFEEFIRSLSTKQKTSLVKVLFETPEDQEEKMKFAKIIPEHYELLQLSVLKVLQLVTELNLSEGSLSKLIDWSAINKDEGMGSLDEKIKEALESVGKSPAKIIEKTDLSNRLALLTSLPLGVLKEKEKEIVYTILVILCHDLSSHPEFTSAIFTSIRTIRELGYRFDGLKYLDLPSQLQILPAGTGQSMLLDVVANYFGDTQQKQIKSLLKKIAKEEEEHKELILLMAHRFSLAKKVHKHEKTMAIYRTKVAKLVFNIYQKDPVSQSPSGLFFALNMYLANKENLTEPNGDLGKVCLAVASNRVMEDPEEVEEHKSKILSYCFQHMAHFQLELPELEKVLVSAWNKLKSIEAAEVIMAKSTVERMSLFNLYVSTETYIEIMAGIDEMANQAVENEKLRFICKHLQNLSRSRINLAKGAVLSEFLKNVLHNVIMKFTLQTEDIYTHPELILDILSCFSTVAQNRHIVMSESLCGNILAFCLDLNLKRFKVVDTNCSTFARIHQQLSELCSNLIQARSVALQNAMPQFVCVLKDLVHTICAFRNGRDESKQNLSENEIDTLANLGHRLEPILSGFGDREHLGKRVAPYLLVYVINEMIFNANSTTLYPSIKMAINNVCYKLIGICDVKYSQFILRGCSEASRDVYKTLVKEYERYYKFAGKV